MLINEFFSLLTRIFFVLLVIITLTNYLRHRDKTRRDVALAVLCLASSSLIRVFLDITGLQAPWLPRVSPFILLAQPYLLLRLVRYFRPIPPLVNRIAIGGMVISWVLLLIGGSPLPPLVVLPIIVYFVAIDGYTVFAFIKGAFSTVGVTRQRLRFVAVGSGLLIGAFLLLGVRIILPDSTLVLTPLIQPIVILSIIAYTLGFAPSRWLRQAWQLTELRDYLQRVHKSDDKTLPGIVDRLRQAVIRTMGTEKAMIALWDKANERLVLQNLPTLPALSDFYLDGVIQNAWRKQSPVVVYRSDNLSKDDLQLMQTFASETLLIIPIVTNDRPLGLLMVFLQYGSLFVEDDVNLLAIFTQQTAVLIENHEMVEELHRYTEDLEEKVQDRTAALQRSNQELRQFAYVASHDLQEPLRTVSLYLQLIEKHYNDKLDNDGREFINFAVDGATRMRDLINALLLYSRVDTKTQNFTQVDSQKAFEEACKLLAVAIAEADATITHDPLPQIRADEQLVIQLFQNLISNGIKYRSSRKPEIHIGARHEKDEWVFCIQDNGIGIEKQYLERIFIIFQRLHNRDDYPGTGIGLAVCKKAVDLHGGRIWAESEIGKGTTFYFTLPDEAAGDVN
jgi:signal transduction histidine kinase